MRAYLVYERNSGIIVHRHRQQDEIDVQVGTERDRILSFVRPSYDRSNLDILVINEEEMEAGTKYRVDPNTKHLFAEEKFMSKEDPRRSPVSPTTKFGESSPPGRTSGSEAAQPGLIHSTGQTSPASVMAGKKAVRLMPHPKSEGKS